MSGFQRQSELLVTLILEQKESPIRRRPLRADLVTAFKIFTGLLYIDPNTFFSLPLYAAQESTPTRYSKAPATAGGEGRHFDEGFEILE